MSLRRFHAFEVSRFSDIRENKIDSENFARSLRTPIVYTQKRKRSIERFDRPFAKLETGQTFARCRSWSP